MTTQITLTKDLVLQFGKWKGLALSQVPDGYLRWLSKRPAEDPIHLHGRNWTELAGVELSRRNHAGISVAEHEALSDLDEVITDSPDDSVDVEEEEGIPTRTLGTGTQHVTSNKKARLVTGKVEKKLYSLIDAVMEQPELLKSFLLRRKREEKFTVWLVGLISEAWAKGTKETSTGEIINVQVVRVHYGKWTWIGNMHQSVGLGSQGPEVDFVDVKPRTSNNDPEVDTSGSTH